MLLKQRRALSPRLLDASLASWETAPIIGALRLDFVASSSVWCRWRPIVSSVEGSSRRWTRFEQVLQSRELHRVVRLHDTDLLGPRSLMGERPVGAWVESSVRTVGVDMVVARQKVGVKRDAVRKVRRCAVLRLRPGIACAAVCRRVRRRVEILTGHIKLGDEQQQRPSTSGGGLRDTAICSHRVSSRYAANVNTQRPRDKRRLRNSAK